MNKVILMGRLTASPELRQSPQGLSVARFNVAVDRRFAKDGGVDFISCVAWRKTAEFVCKYFHKGKMIALEGQMQTRTWEGEDGKTHYATDVLVDNVEFCGKERTTGADSMGEQLGCIGEQYAQRTTSQTQFATSPESMDEFIDINADEDDLPF